MTPRCPEARNRHFHMLPTKLILHLVLFRACVDCFVFRHQLNPRASSAASKQFSVERRFYPTHRRLSPSDASQKISSLPSSYKRTTKWRLSFSRISSFLFPPMNNEKGEDGLGLSSDVAISPSSNAISWTQPSFKDSWEEFVFKMKDSFSNSVVKPNEMQSRETSFDPSTVELDRPIPSGQAQLPLLVRLAKAVYEECVPWILTFIFPALASLVFHSVVPLLCSVIPELVFLAVCSMKVLTKFDKPSYPQPLLQNRDWQYIRESMWSSQEDVSGRRKFLMGWFYDAPFERLRREDTVCYLAWMRFGKMEKQLTYSEQSELLQVDLPKLEQEVNEGRKLPSRASGEEPLPCLRFNLEPLRYRHKPLLYYAVTHGIKELLKFKLCELGFRYMPPKDSKTKLGYWYRPASPKNQDSVPPTPLVFVHGVGGLAFYYQLIKQLSIETQRGCGAAMILFDLPFVSLRVSDDIPSITDQVQSVCETLDETVGKDVKSTFVGHSFGSVLLSWMVQSRPDRVANCVFLDPICFQLHLKDTLFNFHLTRVDLEHQSGKDWGNPFSVGALINLAGTEMHTNNAMLRQFSWATNALWPQDLEKNGISASILLSENDEIVPSADIFKLISKRSNAAWDNFLSMYSDNTFIRADFLRGATHGEFAFNDLHREKVVRKVLSMMRLNNIKRKRYGANSGFPLWNFASSGIAPRPSSTEANELVRE